MNAPQPHKWTVAEYHKMAEAGLFPPDARLELINGELFDMTPMGRMHRGLVIELTARLSEACRGKAMVSPQCPVTLGEDGEPEPDFTVLRSADYRQKAPSADDILLVIEISDSTLDYGRNKKLPMYARNGIPEVWILNVPARTLEIYRQPVDGAYGVEKRITEKLDQRPIGHTGIEVDCVGLF